MLHQGWLDGGSLRQPRPPKILHDKSNIILNTLGFGWLPISQKTFEQYIKQLV
jgi:hypothetical protein